MGPVSLRLVVASGWVGFATRKARDPCLPILAWCLSLSLAPSLVAHLLYAPVGQATPLMLIDAVGLYATGMSSIRRFDAPRWLYVICAAFLAQCPAHLVYIAGVITNQHILVLNLVYISELAAVLAGAGRRAKLAPSHRRRVERLLG